MVAHCEYKGNGRTRLYLNDELLAQCIRERNNKNQLWRV